MYSYFEKEKLREVFFEKYQKTRSKGIDKVSPYLFQNNIEDHLDIIVRKINEDNYTFSNYLEKLIIKNRFNNPRLLCIPTIRDRIVLNQLKDYLHDNLPAGVNRSQAQESVKEIIDFLEEDDSDINYFIRTDIKNFFDKIKHSVLLSKLEETGLDEKTILLIKNAIETYTVPRNYKKEEIEKYQRIEGVPQGLAISNFLSELYLLAFDQTIRKLGCFLLRYVDDILILCKKDDYTKIESTLNNELAKLNLELNEEKTYHGFLDEEFEFLGYIFEGDRYSISEKNIQKRINLIAAKFTWFKNGWVNKERRPNYLKKDDKRFILRFIDELNNIITGIIVDGKKFSFLDYYREVNDKSIFRRLDKLVERFFLNTEPFVKKPEIVKSFTKAYYEVRFNKLTTYLFNLDDIKEVREKRKYLISVGYLYKTKPYTNEEIESAYEHYSAIQTRNNKRFSYTNS